MEIRISTALGQMTPDKGTSLQFSTSRQCIYVTRLRLH